MLVPRNAQTAWNWSRNGSGTCLRFMGPYARISLPPEVTLPRPPTQQAMAVYLTYHLYHLNVNHPGIPSTAQ